MDTQDAHSTDSPSVPSQLDARTALALRREVERFDPSLPIERAHTPPSSWYLEPAFEQLERDTVFSRNWIAVGRTEQLKKPGDYLAGHILGMPYFVIRQDDGLLSAFHNACRHHATELLSGSGCLNHAGGPPRVTCPYHGWTYGTNGDLLNAPRMAGVKDFDRTSMGLRPIPLDTWQGYVFLNLDSDPSPLGTDLTELSARLDQFKTTSLRHMLTRTYTVHCNWKVFVDNYLDGGYHVPVLHHDLASGLDLDHYATEIFDRFSIQGCRAKEGRLGDRALYAWVHPNLMLNRYGKILDINRVMPVSVNRTDVIFDYFFDEESSQEHSFVSDCVAQSEKVQQEDTQISESVQRGLGSPAYDRGRYAPQIENGEHHFHSLLAHDLRSGLADLAS
jgi:choline monooxygenase